MREVVLPDNPCQIRSEATTWSRSPSLRSPGLAFASADGELARQAVTFGHKTKSDGVGDSAASRNLFTQSKSLNDLVIPRDIFALEIIQHAAPFADHF